MIGILPTPSRVQDHLAPHRLLARDEPGGAVAHERGVQIVERDTGIGHRSGHRLHAQVLEAPVGVLGESGHPDPGDDSIEAHQSSPCPLRSRARRR